MLNLQRHKWEEYNIESIVSGKNTDGVSLLELFLKDYSKEFNIKTLNANCKRCLKDYLDKYKSKKKRMDSNCKYILHKKREGLTLSFGSGIYVNNNNINDEYAKKLISKFTSILGDSFTMDYLFSKYPKEDVKNIDCKNNILNTEKPKPVKKTRKPRKTKK